MQDKSVVLSQSSSAEIKKAPSRVSLHSSTRVRLTGHYYDCEWKTYHLHSAKAESYDDFRSWMIKMSAQSVFLQHDYVNCDFFFVMLKTFRHGIQRCFIITLILHNGHSTQIIVSGARHENAGIYLKQCAEIHMDRHECNSTMARNSAGGRKYSWEK